MDRVWGFESDTGDGIVDLYVHYLRKKDIGRSIPGQSGACADSVLMGKAAAVHGRRFA